MPLGQSLKVTEKEVAIRDGAAKLNFMRMVRTDVYKGKGTAGRRSEGRIQGKKAKGRGGSMGKVQSTPNKKRRLRRVPKRKFIPEVREHRVAS